MLINTHKLSFSFFDAAGADAIHIRFLGNDQQWHNVLIDGGYGHTYKTIFGPLIRAIIKEEYIDQWSISHIDQDHIGAVRGFMQDRNISDKTAAVRQFWFNHSPQLVDDNERRKVSVSQGIEFRDFLIENRMSVATGIITHQPPIDLYGLKITVLSPTPEKQDLAKDLWRAIERKGKTARSEEKADHREPFDILIQKNFSEDQDPWNGSSIACLLEFEGIRTLLLADSHPSVIASSLRRLGASESQPLALDFIQLSHHGSKANTSDELLGLIRTYTFVITGNGITNRHPDKETLVRVLTHQLRPAGKVSFVFPCDTPALCNLFVNDQDVLNRYEFCMNFPQTGQGFQILKFIPIEGK